MKIEHIVFDLGGVLIDWNPRRLYEKIFHSDHAIDYFLDNITTSEWNEEQDAGRPIKTANEILINKYPEYTEEILAFYGRWEAEMLGGPIPGMTEVLDFFITSDKYKKVVALTNWSAETFPYALKKFEFLNWFDGILVSGDENLKKPDPRIYQLLIARYNLIPKKTLFFDDSLRNIKAARESGINAIHFEQVDQLKAELVKYNIHI